MVIRMEDIAGLDFSDVADAERIGPVKPGDVLREEFMVPLGLSGRVLARELGVPSSRIIEIVAGERSVTAETAIMPGERFGTSADFWLNLQMARDLELAGQHGRRERRQKASSEFLCSTKWQRPICGCGSAENPTR